jgi:flagellar basal body-associated protein FliL
MEIEDIKQIKPDKKVIQVPKKDESILIPKIEPEKDKDKKRKGNKKHLKVIGIIAGIFVLLTIALGISSFFVFKKAKVFYNASLNLVAIGKAQNLSAIKNELESTKKAYKELKSTYKFILWTKFIPFLGNYTKDGQRLINAAGYGLEAADTLIKVSEPYADILGFVGANVLGEASDGAKTTQERIDFIVKTLPDLVPEVDTIGEKISLVKREIDQINPDRYPVTFRGKPVREKIKKGIDLIDTIDEFIQNGKPLLRQAPYLLGLDSERHYLVLFQNDKELRPTGGFMTAYSIMKVEKARFEPIVSNDIYTLDAKYKPRLKAPEPIITYLKGPYIISKNIRLRDMNWSPDFAQSMKLFSQEAENLGIGEIDGVIAVDTQALVNLLDVLGPIGVPGFGNFSTEIIPECNCSQVIYELESFADVEGPIVWDPVSGKIVYRPPHSDNRKKIIGPLTNSIMANALGQPKEKVPDLFKAAFKSLTEKHVLFYLFDDDAQRAVESFSIAGRIKESQQDYLHINDANLGGRKSNLYVTQEVEQDIEITKDGTITKKVTITYKNPEPHDGWLNSMLPNWVRVYVPKGSKLIDVSGLEESKDPYEEFDKTVFAGFFKLRPQGVSKVTFQYRLPFKAGKNYEMFIQKQPGKDAPLYIIRHKDKQEEFFLRTDRKVGWEI